MEEDKREQEIARGDKAAAVLNNELLKEAFKAVNDSYMNAWEHSTMDESNKRERMWIMSQNLKSVILHLHTVVETGEMAKKQLGGLDQDSLVEEYERKKWGIEV